MKHSLQQFEPQSQHPSFVILLRKQKVTSYFCSPSMVLLLLRPLFMCNNTNHLLVGVVPPLTVGTTLEVAGGVVKGDDLLIVNSAETMDIMRLPVQIFTLMPVKLLPQMNLYRRLSMPNVMSPPTLLIGMLIPGPLLI